METQTPTPKPKLEGAALLEIAAPLAAAIFWQTGASFSDLCGTNRRHDNARVFFCSYLFRRRATAEDIARILNKRPAVIKDFISQGRNDNSPLAVEFRRRIMDFYNGAHD